ncbi:MAG TPA: DUF2975 domain-containing protein [Clostridia bacterium]|nr:DUF2975 domain-containing protein [Clostridia bacterium]
MEKKLANAARGFKAVLLVLAAMRIWLCFWHLPFVEGIAMRKNNPEFAQFYWPCVVWIWCYALPRSLADIGLFRVLSRVQHGSVFSNEVSRTLSRVAFMALFVTLVCLAYGVALAELGAAQPGISLITLFMSIVGAGFFFGLRTLSFTVRLING